MEIINILAITITILLAVYLYLKQVCLTYWKRRGVPYIEPEFFYGNFRKVIKTELAFADVFRDMYTTLKARGAKYGGVYIFFSPMFIAIDIDLIKRIMQNDFDHFINHGNYYNEEADPLSGHLFNLEDGKWKELRAKLTPTFTSGKMKMMFETLLACSDELETTIDDYAVTGQVVEVKDILARFNTDVIGSCAFGIECNSLKNPHSEFRKMGKKIFEPTALDKARFMVTFLFPSYILTKLGFRVIRKDVEDFVMNVVKDTVDYREKNNIFRKDFVHLLLQLKNTGKVTDDKTFTDAKGNTRKQPYLTMNEFSAQCFIFFGAGFETSSTAMTYALYELAENQDIQDKLRENIRSVLERHDYKITYDSIMEMTYLDKVLNETLRLHPPLPGTGRICNKAYTVPGTDVVIEPGTRVHIPIYDLHMDPDYYPDPEVFDPERFNEENKAKRPAIAFIPFGDGPRICIGLRFAMMQSKVGLVRFIMNYRVTLNKKTKVPIELEPSSTISSVKGGVWLNVSKVES